MSLAIEPVRKRLKYDGVGLWNLHNAAFGVFESGGEGCFGVWGVVTDNIFMEYEVLLFVTYDDVNNRIPKDTKGALRNDQ